MDAATASARSRRGNWCSNIARSYSSSSSDVINTIMRKFRPIAPRPPISSSSGSTSNLLINNNILSPTTRRPKRKPDQFPNSNHGKKPTTTLPLLPTAETIGTYSISPPTTTGSSTSSDLAIWWNFVDDNDEEEDQVVMMPRQETVRVSGSIVTVECVMDTWGGDDDTAMLLYRQLDEKRMMMKLEMDACPVFISDTCGGDKVVWTNRAYRDMVGQEAEDQHHRHEIKLVWLAVKEKEKGGIIEYGRAFSCRVRMEYTRHGKERRSITLPCDVWRMMDGVGGGYAWRLDIKAALSLGP